MSDTTTIEVSRENWRRLNSRKYPGESFNDVLGRLLSESEGTEAAEATEPPAGEIEPEPVDVDADDQEPAHDAAQVLDERDDLPGSDARLDRRKAELLRLYDILRERGEATTGELQEEIDLAGTGYSSTHSFWTHFVSEIEPNPLGQLPGVDEPGRGERTWIFND